ncbi:hypothetical protein [Polaromonas sp.]|uniref:hypothetical protein n=1 Tax=Polaromonas sp. TaxID=1869339 RepID=UPI003267415A
MQIITHSLFAETFRPTPGLSVLGANAISIPDVQVQMARDLDSEVSEYLERDQEVVGWCEFVGKGFLGVGEEARAQAKQVGATMVLFSLWPAKLRAVKYRENGSIDLGSVVADPPAALSPKGHYVLRAAFLRSNKALHPTAFGVD